MPIKKLLFLLIPFLVFTYFFLFSNQSVKPVFACDWCETATYDTVYDQCWADGGCEFENFTCWDGFWYDCDEYQCETGNCFGDPCPTCSPDWSCGYTDCSASCNGGTNEFICHDNNGCFPDDSSGPQACNTQACTPPCTPIIPIVLKQAVMLPVIRQDILPEPVQIKIIAVMVM